MERQTSIVLATHNPAKANRLSRLFDLVPNLHLVSLTDLGISQKVDEPFETAEQNAIHKAQFYSDLTGEICVALDEAATTNFLPEGEQPGVYVRRNGPSGAERTDPQMLEFWRETLGRFELPKEKLIVWDFQFAFANSRTGQSASSQVLVLCTVRQPFSPVIEPGYPMSSFLVFPTTSRPFSELTAEEKIALDRRLFQSAVTTFARWLALSLR